MNPSRHRRVLEAVALAAAVHLPPVKCDVVPQHLKMKLSEYKAAIKTAYNLGWLWKDEHDHLCLASNGKIYLERYTLTGVVPEAHLMAILRVLQKESITETDWEFAELTYAEFLRARREILSKGMAWFSRGNLYISDTGLNYIEDHLGLVTDDMLSDWADWYCASVISGRPPEHYLPRVKARHLRRARAYAIKTGLVERVAEVHPQNRTRFFVDRLTPGGEYRGGRRLEYFKYERGGLP